MSNLCAYVRALEGGGAHRIDPVVKLLWDLSCIVIQLDDTRPNALCTLQEFDIYSEGILILRHEEPFFADPGR